MGSLIPKNISQSFGKTVDRTGEKWYIEASHKRTDVNAAFG